MECNAICVGLSQFTSTIVIGFVIGLIPIAIIAGIINAIESARSSRVTEKAITRARETELSYYTMPMSDPDAAIKQLQREEEWQDVSWKVRCDPRYRTLDARAVEIRRARQQFDNHADAKLFPGAVTKIAEMEMCRSVMRMGPNSYYAEKLAKVETEFDEARANARLAVDRARRVAATKAILLTIPGVRLFAPGARWVNLPPWAAAMVAILGPVLVALAIALLAALWR